jgi:hypothetical protein
LENYFISALETQTPLGFLSASFKAADVMLRLNVFTINPFALVDLKLPLNLPPKTIEDEAKALRVCLIIITVRVSHYKEVNIFALI